MLAGALLLAGTVGVANAAETDRRLDETIALRDRTAVMYDRLDSAIVRARNAIADTSADQYDDPTLLDEITRTLDHYDAYDPHLPANIDPSKVSLDTVEANLDAAYANAADWLTDANTLIDRAVQSRNLKLFHDAEARLSGALDAARATLSDSENRVDSTANRDELSALVGEADGTLAAARSRHEADGDSMPGDWSDMTGIADRLDAERGEVETDVQAYEARIAAEQAAAVQASYGAGSTASYGSGETRTIRPTCPIRTRRPATGRPARAPWIRASNRRAPAAKGSSTAAVSPSSPGGRPPSTRSTPTPAEHGSTV